MLNKFLFLILTISILSCNSKKTETKLTILGTMHFPTEKIDADSIYEVLKKVNPDYILMEIDSSFFNSDFTFKKTFDENEYNAVAKYQKEKPSVKIRPIEFEGRNKYRKSIGIFPEASLSFQKLNKLHNEKLYKADEQKIWDKYEYYWSLADSLDNGNLKAINNKKADNIIDSLMYYQYSELLKITNSRTEFEDSGLIDAKKDTITLKEYYKKWSEFEGTDRNNALSNNTLNIVKNNPNNTFIVLTGFKHRFYIIKTLRQKQKEHNFELIEFYEY
ncbi:hypothetical protein [uncultured Winogradskyella sp.]|uniref:hypothetical protein n=1 Tax=uncultured Winogradskyella sp. TaxID=395353 RepID=UPI0030EE8018